MSRPQAARRKVLAALLEFGPIRDRSGRATSRLADAMGYESRPVSLNPLLLLLEEDGLVEREVRGRRCFCIELTAKGRAMVELDIGLDGRALAVGDRTDTTGGRQGDDSIEAPGAGPWSAVELLRRDVREVLMELGAMRRRLSEVERELKSRPAATDVVAPPTDHAVEPLRQPRTG